METIANLAFKLIAKGRAGVVMSAIGIVLVILAAAGGYGNNLRIVDTAGRISVGILGLALIITGILIEHQIGLTRRVADNEKALEALILYKPGAIAYDLLLKIANKDPEVFDPSHEDKRRCLNLLLDDGYLQPARDGEYINFSDKKYKDEKMRWRYCDIVSLTPIAKNLIKLREGL